MSCGSKIGSVAIGLAITGASIGTAAAAQITPHMNMPAPHMNMPAPHITPHINVPAYRTIGRYTGVGTRRARGFESSRLHIAAPPPGRSEERTEHGASNYISLSRTWPRSKNRDCAGFLRITARGLRGSKRR